MTTVIGIDPSLAGLGLSMFADRVLTVSTLRSKPTPDPYGWAAPARRERLLSDLFPLLNNADTFRGATLAVLEARIKPSAEGMRGSSTMDVAALRATIEDGLYRLRIPMVEVWPSTLKRYATGRGDSPKSAMVKAARDALGTVCPIGNDNEADAFWLMVMGLQRYHIATGPMFDRVWIRCLDKVRWPVFNPRGVEVL